MPKNVSQDEVEKFNQFANNWWDPNGPMRPLHVLNPLRVEYIKQHTILANQRSLDVGCGAGLLSEALAQSESIVTAIDMSDQSITIAKQHAIQQHLKIDYKCTTIEELITDKTEQFDVVTCMEMLEHVPDPQSIINSCAKAAKKGAKLFFSTLNRNPKSYLMAVLGAEYILNLLPKGTHDYKKFIKPSELDKWARHAGLVLVNLSGVSYNPWRETAKLTDDTRVNYMCCYEKP